MTTDFDALIRDIEAATGPDRALDERVALALGWRRETVGPGQTSWHAPDGFYYSEPPNFTGSHDAARGTLVCYAYSVTYLIGGRVHVIIWKSGKRFDGYAATEILAMLAASMRLKQRKG